MAGGSSGAGRSVTSRALGVLDAFDAEHPRLTLTELARRSGTPLATAHRLISELVAWGAVSRRPDGRFEIGRKLWDLGLLAPVQAELRQVANPFLLDVHTATRDTVHLAVRDGLTALYVDRVSGRESVPVVSQVGSRLPLHATGVGKVLLAAAPDDVVETALQSLTRETRYTVVDPARLARELAAVRRSGVAWTSEEMSLGTASVAVPVPVVTGGVGGQGRGHGGVGGQGRGHGGVGWQGRGHGRVEGQGRGHGGRTVVAAALGIVVPTHRADRARDLARLVPVLQVAARGIGRELARSEEFR